MSTRNDKMLDRILRVNKAADFRRKDIDSDANRIESKHASFNKYWTMNMVIRYHKFPHRLLNKNQHKIRQHTLGLKQQL